MSEFEDKHLTMAPDGKAPAEQPAWRTEFPIDSPQDQYVARREFTKFLTLTSLGFVVGQIWLALRSWFGRSQAAAPPRKLLGPEAQLREQLARTGAVVFQYPNEEQECLLLLHSDGQTLVAYDQKCTHLSCAVVPHPTQRCLFCPCHHGYFDTTTGRPLAGPPRRPLPRIELEVADGLVYAINVEVRTV